MTFDDVLPTLVRVCEGVPGFVDLKRCCVVRDLRGRVRLVIEPKPGDTSLDADALASAIAAELGAYFAGPIWSTVGRKPDERRLAAEILNPSRAQRWEPSYADPVTGEKDKRAAANWHKYERRLSKQEWLESSARNVPWELGGGRPGVVTFYSFKGGVGRTTSLVACAWQLARAGKRVVVLDLDLEAPGVGLLLGAESERGMIDFLVDHLATGEASLEGCVVPADALGADSARVKVVPAGKLGPSYLEKLARLDFVGGSAKGGGDAARSPIEEALQVLLQQLRGVTFEGGGRADYIFIDARAGLHDLAGLSLHRLAHVDILIGRTSEQTYPGLQLSLATLVRRKGRARLQCVLVQTMVDTEGTLIARTQEAEFLARSYGWFKEYVYEEEKAATVELDDDDAHRPLVIRAVEARGRFATLLSIEETMFARDYSQLRERIELLCTGTMEDTA